LILITIILYTGCAARLYAPQNLSVSLVDGKLGALLLSWDPVPDAAGYIVQYGIDENFNLSSGQISTAAWTVQGLNTYQTDAHKLGHRDEYQFRVITVDAKGKQSKASDTIIGRAEVPSVANITVEPGRRRQLIVNWDHMEGSSHVNLRWGPTNDIGASIEDSHTFGAPVQGTYTIIGLDEDTEYFVWIQAAAMLTQNDDTQWFDGRWSQAVSGTTLAP
jgi:hypothetical protein